MSCHFLLRGIFLTQGLNPCLLHWQGDSLPLSHQGSPSIRIRHFSLSWVSFRCSYVVHSLLCCGHGAVGRLREPLSEIQLHCLYNSNVITSFQLFKPRAVSKPVSVEQQNGWRRGTAGEEGWDPAEGEKWERSCLGASNASQTGTKVLLLFPVEAQKVFLQYNNIKRLRSKQL